MFIINLTNSKTKKQLMKIFNHTIPSVIITKDGLIQMCNESFDQLIQENLKNTNMPVNLLKFIVNDTIAYCKLTEII